MKLSKTCKRYLLAFLIGIAISLLILLSKGTFSKTDILERYKDLSDAFFVSGFMLAGVGGLVFVGNNGVFDMIRFGVSKVVSLIRSEKHRSETARTYYDYLQKKAEKPSASYGFLLVSGSCLLVLSVLFAFM